MNMKNDFIVRLNNGDYEKWGDGSFVIYGFVDGQNEEEIRYNHQLLDTDEIIYVEKIPKKSWIYKELVNQIKGE